MLKCFFMKKKLYEYLDNALSEEQKLQVERHLEVCLFCRTQLEQMSRIINLAESKPVPVLSEEFWHNFKMELDRKLNARLVSPLKFKPAWAYSLKPALALTSVIIIVLSLSFYFYNKPPSLNKEDLALIEEVRILDEVSMQPYFNHSEDAYIEEYYLQSQINQNPT